MPFIHTPACNLYCDGAVHGMIVLSPLRSPCDQFAAYAAALGCTFVSARLAPEVDLAVIGPTMGHAWDPDTNSFGPPDITPAHVAWLVRMHIPEAYHDPVVSYALPVRPPWYRRWFMRRGL